MQLFLSQVFPLYMILRMWSIVPPCPLYLVALWSTIQNYKGHAPIPPPCS
jgi:hypothetical protein